MMINMYSFELKLKLLEIPKFNPQSEALASKDFLTM